MLGNGDRREDEDDARQTSLADCRRRHPGQASLDDVYRGTGLRFSFKLRRNTRDFLDFFYLFTLFSFRRLSSLFSFLVESSSSSIHSFPHPYLPTFHATAFPPDSSSTIPLDPYRSSVSPRPSQHRPTIPHLFPCSYYAALLDPFFTCLRFSRRLVGRRRGSTIFSVPGLTQRR